MDGPRTRSRTTEEERREKDGLSKLNFEVRMEREEDWSSSKELPTVRRREREESEDAAAEEKEDISTPKSWS